MKNNPFPPGFEKDKENLAIDFDGVIHDWSKGWHDGTCYGNPINGAIEAIPITSNTPVNKIPKKINIKFLRSRFVNKVIRFFFSDII